MSDSTVVSPYAINGSRWNFGLCRKESGFPNPEYKKTAALSSIIIGIVASLVGLFLILASLQVLPNDINAINQLGVWGTVVGGIILGLGVSAKIYGLACLYFGNTCVASSGTVQSEPESVQYDEMGAKRRFHSMSRRYDLAVEKTPKDSIAGRNHITNLWNGLDVFAQSYPEFRSQMPEKPI